MAFGGALPAVAGLQPNSVIQPVAPLAGGSNAGPTSSLQSVKKIRSDFPETWLWTNTTTG